MSVALLLFSSCIHAGLPEYMRAAEGVRIVIPDTDQSFVLTSSEASGLMDDFDGRLLANGMFAPEEVWQGKSHLLTVIYPSPGSGETHIHVYSDGTVGRFRTMQTYETYPMEKYCKAAIRLAEQHGLIASKGSGTNQLLPSFQR